MNEQARIAQISAQDLMILGADSLAYIRPVSQRDQLVWRIHAADGTVLGESADWEVARAACRQQGLEPMSVH